LPEYTNYFVKYKALRCKVVCNNKTTRQQHKSEFCTKKENANLELHAATEDTLTLLRLLNTFCFCRAAQAYSRLAVALGKNETTCRICWLHTAR
jgi:hypothetical protein